MQTKNIEVIQLVGAMLRISGTCYNNHPIEFIVNEAGWDNWKSGMPIQDAMPNVSENNCEFLISGMCGECFDAMCDKIEADEDAWAREAEEE